MFTFGSKGFNNPPSLSSKPGCAYTIVGGEKNSGGFEIVQVIYFFCVCFVLCVVFVRKNEKMGEEEELLLVWDYIFSMCVLNKSPIFTI